MYPGKKICSEPWLLPAISLGIALLVMVSCSGGMKGLKGEDKVFLEPDFWEKAESLFGDHGGGYWLRNKATTIRYEGGEWYVTEEHHYQIVVLDAEKMEIWADVSIPFGPSSRIVELKARTIKSTGKIIPVDSKNIYEKSRIPGYMLFSDRKSRVFAMPGFEDRCIIDLAYEVEDQTFYFMDEFNFGSSLPVRRATYSYSLDEGLYAAGYRVYYRSYSLDARPEDTSYETHFGKMIRWVWQAANLDAYPFERWMPPRERFIPRIALSGFAPDERSDDWNSFTRWYDRLLPKFDEKNAEIDAFAEEVIGEAENADDAVQKTLDYFGDNLRYVSIGIDDSGWRPNHPGDVIRNQYGDCKDMSCLAVMLLRKKGFDAYPALLRTKSAGDIDRVLVAPRFDHMIVYVNTDHGDVWMDPTTAPCPAGYLPPADRDVDVLVVQDRTAVWKRTPATTRFGSSRTAVTSIALAPTGMLSGTSQVVFTGDMGLGLKREYEYAAKSELSKAIEDDFVSCFRGITVDSCSIVDVADELPVVRISGRFSKPAAGIRVDDKLLLRLDFLNPRTPLLAEIPKGSARKYPLWFPHSWEETDTLYVRVPEGWEAERTPMDVSSSGKYGSYSMTCSTGDQAVVVAISYGIQAGDIQGSLFDDFVGFWAEARERLAQEIIFKKL